MKTTIAISLVLGLSTAAGCAAKDQTATPTNAPTASAEESPAAKTAESSTIVDIAVADGNFETLVAALQAAGLDEALAGDGPFTVFAPTDEAFAKLPEGTIEALLADTDTLTKILTYHVVPGKVMASDVVSLDSAETVAGMPLKIKVKDGKVKVGDAMVVTTDIRASNGVIHVIDSVLIPQGD